MVFLQMLLFRKPWRYFCNKALRDSVVRYMTIKTRHCRTSRRVAA